jgi:hypothetical protein
MDQHVEFTKHLIGFSVVDAAGAPLGSLSALYTDAESGEVVFGAITMSRRRRRRTVLLPLDSARVDGNTITVRCGSKLVRRAPATQSGHGLAAHSEADLYAHYDMSYTPVESATCRLVPAQD